MFIPSLFLSYPHETDPVLLAVHPQRVNLWYIMFNNHGSVYKSMLDVCVPKKLCKLLSYIYGSVVYEGAKNLYELQLVQVRDEYEVNPTLPHC